MLTSLNYKDTQSKNYAIGVSWYILSNRRNQFRKELKNSLLPSLTILQNTGKITMVLSLMHKPLKVKGASNNNSWSDYLLIMLTTGEEPTELWKQLVGMIDKVSLTIPQSLLRVEVLRPQKMPLALPTIRLRHVLEYALSKPGKKTEYYNDQYAFSGPVIRQFLEMKAVGSFIGLERISYLQNSTTIPEWDVIHITGFKWRWLIKILWVLYNSASFFHAIARKTGYCSAWDVLKSWDAKRKKFLRIATQDDVCTLFPL